MKHADFILAKNRPKEEENEWTEPKWIPFWRKPRDFYDDDYFVGAFPPSSDYIGGGRFHCDDEFYDEFMGQFLPWLEVKCQINKKIEEEILNSRRLDFESDRPPHHEFWTEEEWEEWKLGDEGQNVD